MTSMPWKARTLTPPARAPQPAAPIGVARHSLGMALNTPKRVAWAVLTYTSQWHIATKVQPKCKQSATRVQPKCNQKSATEESHLQDSWQDATVELREAFILGDGVHAVEKAVVLWILREKLVVNELDLDRLLRSGHKNALHRARAKASHETLRFSEAKAVASVLIDQKA
eukprot:scaffold328_cov248-Pinguiococcus_pyrenoidosus.AAC.9